jgi:hypothetical protein
VPKEIVSPKRRASQVLCDHANVGLGIQSSSTAKARFPDLDSA